MRTFDGMMFSIPTSCEYALVEFADAKVSGTQLSGNSKFILHMFYDVFKKVSVRMKDPQDLGLTAIKKVTVSRGVQSVIFLPDESGKLRPRDSRGR